MDLLAKIEFLRQAMHKAALEKGIAHPEVLAISQTLDIAINQCYKQLY